MGVFTKWEDRERMEPKALKLPTPCPICGGGSWGWKRDLDGKQILVRTEHDLEKHGLA